MPLKNSLSSSFCLVLISGPTIFVGIVSQELYKEVELLFHQRFLFDFRHVGKITSQSLSFF